MKTHGYDEMNHYDKILNRANDRCNKGEVSVNDVYHDNEVKEACKKLNLDVDVWICNLIK